MISLRGIRWRWISPFHSKSKKQKIHSILQTKQKKNNRRKAQRRIKTQDWTTLREPLGERGRLLPMPEAPPVTSADMPGLSSISPARGWGAVELLRNRSGEVRDAKRDEAIGYKYKAPAGTRNCRGRSGGRRRCRGVYSALLSYWIEYVLIIPCRIRFAVPVSVSIRVVLVTHSSLPEAQACESRAPTVSLPGR